jgi:hypothetical protein
MFRYVCKVLDMFVCVHVVRKASSSVPLTVMGIVGCVPGRYPSAGVSQCPLSIVHCHSLSFVVPHLLFLIQHLTSDIHLSRGVGVGCLMWSLVDSSSLGSFYNLETKEKKS